MVFKLDGDRRSSVVVPGAGPAPVIVVQAHSYAVRTTVVARIFTVGAAGGVSSPFVGVIEIMQQLLLGFGSRKRERRGCERV